MGDLVGTFTVDRLLRIVVTAVAVGVLMRLAQFVLQRAGAPVSKNETVFLGTGVMVFLLMTDTIRDIPTAERLNDRACRSVVLRTPQGLDGTRNSTAT